MAVNDIFIAAAPARVFEVLADPAAYAEWVVGTTEVTSEHDDFPRPGTKLDWQVGPVGEVTEVLGAEPPHRLLLRVVLPRGGSIRIELTLREEASGTRVQMLEEPEEGVVAVLDNPLVDRVLKLRNDVSLGRLKELAEAR